MQKTVQIGKLQEDVGLVATAGPHASDYFLIKEFPCIIGRGTGNPVSLAKDSYVSSLHCELDRDGNQHWLKDLDSTNGTYVNGTHIQKPTRIFPQKSTICIGKTQLLLVVGKQTNDNESRVIALKNLLSPESILIPPSGFFQKQKREESLLVLDICNSSGLAHLYGENALLKVVYLLGKILTRHAEANEVQFLKCTGDGFFATFEQTKQALRVACCLLQDIESTVRKKPEMPSFGLRIAVHRGPVSTDKSGDRLGLACHLVFRLQEAKLENRVSAPEAVSDLPEEDRVLLTNEAIRSLDKSLSNCFAYIGDFMFKGFNNSVRVNILDASIDILLKRMS